MRHTEKERSEARERLLQVVKPGVRIYTILRHRSSSGMSRVIDLKFISSGTKGRPEIWNIGYNTAVALGMSWSERHEGVKVSGCGMDMGYHIVYALGEHLFGRGEETKKLGHHTGRNGEEGAEHDGGYLLEHSWL